MSEGAKASIDSPCGDGGDEASASPHPASTCPPPSCRGPSLACTPRTSFRGTGCPTPTTTIPAATTAVTIIRRWRRRAGQRTVVGVVEDLDLDFILEGPFLMDPTVARRRRFNDGQNHLRRDLLWVDAPHRKLEGRIIPTMHCGRVQLPYPAPLVEQMLRRL